MADSDNESEEIGNPCARNQSEKMRIPYQNTKYRDDEKKNFLTVENNLHVGNGNVIVNVTSDRVNQCNSNTGIVNTTGKNIGGNTYYKKNFENIFSRRSSTSTAPTTGTYCVVFICIVSYCIALRSIILYCTGSDCIVLYCTVL